MTRDGPLLPALAAIALGAVLGAWLRWVLSYWLNPRVAHLPLLRRRFEIHARSSSHL
jgi:hypothetical protein